MSDANAKPMPKKDTLVDKMQNVLAPIGAKLGSFKYLQAMQGLMVSMPMTIAGAIINILANPPMTADFVKGGIGSIFAPWYNFATANHDLLNIPYNMTMGMIGIFAVLGISYKLGTIYKMKGISHCIVALSMFLMVAAPQTTALMMEALPQALQAGDAVQAAQMATAVLPASYLGAGGIFSAIVVAIVSVEIIRFCQERNLVIKMPDSVPPMVSQSFSAVIPLVFNIIFFFGLNVGLQQFFGISLPEVISTILSPVVSGVSNPIVMICVMMLAMFLWTLGIHGMSIVAPIIMPIFMQAVLGNAELVQNGGAAVVSAVLLFTAPGTGGSGGTLGLCILGLRSKSKQIRTISRISLVPGFCQINEPMVFGMPIMYNPILMIPFLLTSLAMMLAMWACLCAGLISPQINVVLAMLPMGVGALLSTGDFRNFLFCWLMIPLQMLIYYPFFKVYERQLVAEETAAEAQTAEA